MSRSDSMGIRFPQPHNKRSPNNILKPENSPKESRISTSLFIVDTLGLGNIWTVLGFSQRLVRYQEEVIMRTEWTQEKLQMGHAPHTSPSYVPPLEDGRGWNRLDTTNPTHRSIETGRNMIGLSCCYGAVTLLLNHEPDFCWFAIWCQGLSN